MSRVDVVKCCGWVNESTDCFVKDFEQSGRQKM